jgi:hypothetical protein
MARLIRRPARPIPKDSACRIPDIEACGVKLHTAAGLPAQPLHHHLGLCHGLAAAVAGLSVAQAAPHTGDVVGGGRTRASGANPKARVQAADSVPGSPRARLVDLGRMTRDAF